MLVLGRWSNLIRARYVTPICLQGQANKKQEYVEKIETINRIQTAQQDIINWLSAQSVLFEERYKMSWVNRQYWSKSARVIMIFVFWTSLFDLDFINLYLSKCLKSKVMPTFQVAKCIDSYERTIKCVEKSTEDRRACARRFRVKAQYGKCDLELKHSMLSVI